ncbi:hypothetical protein HG535_0G00320 [Zygotorulaspora mrakii]|uniref:Uncharacterized protein n=1 Tax=Zygotorulaspora mrakii TaxID=42260 RepID=A0A7H9B6F1_ZYGMR|nr:uncharacterized protein HG535_0G00320 [Zygotorulaspora mrakii]QLG74147.1 hypothetical protein HG535_0G00320 [Zygotorulaspora mrakii]
MNHVLLSPFTDSENSKTLNSLSPADFISSLSSNLGKGATSTRLVDSDATVNFYNSSNDRGDIWVTPDRRTVEWCVDDQCIRRFHYDNDVIKANFVDFATCNDCLVIVLQDMAHVYYIAKGDSTTVCFPFPVSNAFWCLQGIVLERKLPGNVEFYDLSDLDIQHRFITLSDPMAPFGHIEFSNKEKDGKSFKKLQNLSMLAFPSGENYHIAVLFDHVELKLHFYYTQLRLNSKNNDSASTVLNSPDSRKESRLDNVSSVSNSTKNLRKVSILNRRAASVNMTQDINDSSVLLPSGKKNQDSQPLPPSHSYPHNTRRTASATLDRMSGATSMAAASPNIDFSLNQNQQNLQPSHMPAQTQMHIQHQGQQFDQHQNQIESLSQAITSKADVTLTKISSMTLPHRISNDPSIKLKCIPIRFEDKEGIAIFDPKTRFSKIWLIDLLPEIINSISFKVYGNSPPNLIRLLSFNVDGVITDIFPYISSFLCGTLAIVFESHNELCLYNPFIDLSSPKEALNERICFISEKRMVKNKFQPTGIVPEYPKKDLQCLPTLFPLPKRSLVKHCFGAMKWICSPIVLFSVIFSWQSLMSKSQPERKIDISGSEFSAFSTVFELLILKSEKENCELEKTNGTQAFKYLDKLDLKTYLPKIIMGLHLIREELCLNILCKDDITRLGDFLSFFTSKMNWPLSWREYYGSQNYSADDIEPLIGVFAHPLDEPPSIMRSLYSITENSYLSVTPFISFSRLVEMDSEIDQIVTPQSYKILRLYEMIRAPNYSDQFLLEVLTNLKIEKEDIELYPIGIITPLKKMLQRVEDRLSQAGSSVNLSVIKRHDLKRYVGAIKHIANEIEIAFENNAQISKIVPGGFKNYSMSKPRDIFTILSDVVKSSRHFNTEKGLVTDNFQYTDDFDEGHTLKSNAALIFSEDRRFNDALTLLIYYKPHNVQFFSVASDYRKILKQKKNIARILSIRTCLSGLGLGAVTYSTEKPLATQKWMKPQLNFTYLFPDGTKISMEYTELDKEILDWGEFHGGVSSGLRISRKAKGINGSWIAFNNPKVLDAQQGGFLLGLGLNGHLRGLEEWHVYNYLSPKKTHVSIGLLLGMSASMKGTMDLKLTKVLSVHIVALLPPGSSDLNINLKVQTAGIIGIGLLYLMSHHRRMSELLYSQLTSLIIVNDEQVCDESYRIAAGISLGLINLGSGENFNSIKRGPNMTDQDESLEQISTSKTGPDEKLINGLLQILTECHDSEQDWIPENSQISAAIALILIFLKTKNHSIANTIRPNLKSMHMNFLPHIFMYREMAFHMIMWQTIGKDLDYLLEGLEDHIEPNVNTDNLPTYYIISARALSMGIKYASTGNLDMRNVLIHLIDRFLPFYQYPGDNRLDFRLTIIGINVLVNVLLVSVSLIMCGSGDLQVFRRIRYLHEVVSGKHSDLFKSYRGTQKNKKKVRKSSRRSASSGREFAVDDMDIEVEEDDVELERQHQGNDTGEEDEENEEYIEEESAFAPGENSESLSDEGSERDEDTTGLGSQGNDKKDDENHYAKFLASTMSLGFLFFGSGQYALRTSDHESISYLIISTLPTYMSTPPLQETKYFWSMAVEPRCLMFRDAKTEMPINDVFFQLKACFNEDILEEKNLKAPCLLPDIRKIQSLKVSDPNYYPLEISFGEKLKATDFFKTGSIVYIQRREQSNLADYGSNIESTQSVTNIQEALRKKMENNSQTVGNKECYSNIGDKLMEDLNLNDTTMIELETLTNERDVFTNDTRTYDLDMLCSDANSGDISEFHLEIWRKKHCA